jgi:transcriptional regulator with XRE-family HTH domain
MPSKDLQSRGGGGRKMVGRMVEAKAPRGKSWPKTDEWYMGLARRLRETVGDLSGRQIAARTGTNFETVRRYMHGGRPCAQFLAAIIEEFRVDADWLLTGRVPIALAGSCPKRGAKATLAVALDVRGEEVTVGRVACWAGEPLGARAAAGSAEARSLELVAR